MKNRILIAAIVVVALGCGTAAFFKARANACRNDCINNLRQIHSASHSWGLSQGKERGAEIDLQEISAYIKDGFPVCLSGGKYTVPPLGLSPSCSVHGKL